MSEPLRQTAEPAVEFLPHDEHNLNLIENVHPSGYVNPEPAPRYHLVVIGAGTAGLVSAAGAAGLGAKVALIERHLMGGDCLNVGCVPSKGVIRPARAWHEARTAAERFGGPAVSGDGDFAAAMERMRRIRAGISKHDSVERFRSLGIDVFLGQGRFVASDAVEVDGQRLRFRRAVIATGARAAAPPIPGLDEVPYLTNETIFSLTELPRRFAVIGGGPIGCEMAQSFARFGSQVTLFDVAPTVLGREDPDAGAIVQKSMERDGVRFVLDCRVSRVERQGGEILIHYDRDGETHQCCPSDQVLVAVGRAPNLEGLDLEAAGVQYTKHGVVVDDRLRTTNKRIYAAGDISSKYKFTHIADAEARIVIQNALFFGRKKASDLVVPWCTYTSPELAHVGLYEKEAREQGHAVDSLTIPLSDVDRALLDGEDEGFVRVLYETKKGRVLGATIVAEHAGDMIGEMSMAVTAGVSLGTVATVIHPYPTQAEAIKKAGDAYNRTKLTETVKKIFGWWFRMFQ